MRKRAQAFLFASLRRTLATVLALVLSVAAGILVVHLTKSESSGERLAKFLASEQFHGEEVAADVHVNFTGSDPAEILILRDRFGVLSDKIVVLDHAGGSLHVAFCFEPVPATLYRVSAAKPSCSFGRDMYSQFRTSGPFIAKSDPTPRDLESNEVGVGDLSFPDQRYLVSYEGSAPITPQGDPNLLFVLNGDDSYSRYPVLLSHEVLGGYRVTAPLTERVAISLRPHATADDRLLLSHLYGLPPQSILDATGYSRRLTEYGASAFALYNYAGGEFLIAGYVVSQEAQGGREYKDCSTNVGGHFRRSCSEVRTGSPAPAYFDMKAWRITRDVGDLIPIPCDGARKIVRTAALKEVTALVQAWHSYVAAPRFCGSTPPLGWRATLLLSSGSVESTSSYRPQHR